MNRLIEAALELHEFLTRHAVPYAIIGGVAVQVWGDGSIFRGNLLTPFYGR